MSLSAAPSGTSTIPKSPRRHEGNSGCMHEGNGDAVLIRPACGISLLYACVTRGIFRIFPIHGLRGPGKSQRDTTPGTRDWGIG
jgi:hypothetical protein